MDNPLSTRGESWHDLRDERGKLCARIDSDRMLLEIRRSDRAMVAVFDLREYMVELHPLEIGGDIR